LLRRLWLDHVTVIQLFPRLGIPDLHYNDNAAPRRLQFNLAAGQIPPRTLSAEFWQSFVGVAPLPRGSHVCPLHVVHTVSFEYVQCQQCYLYRPQQPWKGQFSCVYDAAVRFSRHILLTICGVPASLFLLAVSPCTTQRVSARIR